VTFPRPDLFHLPANRAAFTSHSRYWATNRYVYPVISRRSGGLSIGINLNPDKACNFDCIYCSVNRKLPGDQSPIDLKCLTDELSAMLRVAKSGELFKHPSFAQVSPELRRLNDIAFSGDGEPTSCTELLATFRLAKAELDDQKLSGVKIILITNATLLHRPPVQQALNFLDACHSEIWAKLDAGTDAYYKMVDRTSIPLNRVLSNITQCALQRPIVIQSLFMKVHNASPPPKEIDAYGQRLAAIVSAGGKLKRVQIYTVAREPAEAYASPLRVEELDEIAAKVRRCLPATPTVQVEVFP
jgi:wyosine [tRNA(Phe)-imidazoG37] synthetase (radical SAM superfamily)